MVTSSSISPPRPPKPAADAERHGFVDALRGFALLGILLVNIEFIVQPAEIGWADYAGRVDTAVRWLVIALGQTKIYPLFALLFGYGLSLQLRKAQHAADDLWPRYRRRMVGLAALGVAHGILFFPGDILVIYALVGAVAYRLRSLDTPRLLRVAAWVYGLTAFGWLAVGVIDASFGGGSSTKSVPAEAFSILNEGSFPEVVAVHAFYWIVTLGILLIVQGPAVFAAFLAGVALGRTRLLADPDRHQELAWGVPRWAPLGLVGGGLGATLTIVGGRWESLGFAIGFASAPLLAAGYLAALALALRRFRRVSAVLQASGRMSLSVYLLESVLVTTLAYGYGVGLFATTGPLAGVALAFGIWLALSAFSVAWMRVARFGPFEWLLRSFTYSRWQPLRR